MVHVNAIVTNRRLCFREKGGGKTNQAPGQERPEAGDTGTLLYFFSPSSHSISAGVYFITYKIPSPQSILTDSLRTYSGQQYKQSGVTAVRNLMWWKLYADGWLALSIEVSNNNSHR